MPYFDFHLIVGQGSNTLGSGGGGRSMQALRNSQGVIDVTLRNVTRGEGGGSNIVQKSVT